jgi:hypothetical protein
LSFSWEIFRFGFWNENWSFLGKFWLIWFAHQGFFNGFLIEELIIWQTFKSGKTLYRALHFSSENGSSDMALQTLERCLIKAVLWVSTRSSK